MALPQTSPSWLSQIPGPAVTTTSGTLNIAINRQPNLVFDAGFFGVTLDQLNQQNILTFIGPSGSSGSYIPDPGGEENGDMLFYEGGEWNLRHIGTSGQLLTVFEGSPTWVTPAALELFVGGTPTESTTTLGVDNVTVKLTTVSGIPTLSAVTGSGGGGDNLTGSSTARPSATDSGDSYWSTDVPVTSIDNGTWTDVVTKGLVQGAGLTSSWVTSSQLNLVQKGDTILSYFQSNSNGYPWALQAITSSLSGSHGWQVRLKANFTFPDQGGAMYAVVANGTASATSSAVGCGVWYDDGYSGVIWNDTFTLDGSRASQSSTNITYAYNGGIVHARWVCDGVKIYPEFSSDGYTWYQPSAAYAGYALPTGTAYFGWSNGNLASAASNNIATIYECVCIAATQLTITGSNVAGGYVNVTCSAPHGMCNGTQLSIQGVTTNTGTPPNGVYGGNGNSTMFVVSPTIFKVSTEYTSAFTYLSGGYVTRLDI